MKMIVVFSKQYKLFEIFEILNNSINIYYNCIKNIIFRDNI